VLAGCDQLHFTLVFARTDTIASSAAEPLDREVGGARPAPGLATLRGSEAVLRPELADLRSGVYGSRLCSLYLCLCATPRARPTEATDDQSDGLLGSW